MTGPHPARLVDAADEESASGPGLLVIDDETVAATLARWGHPVRTVERRLDAILRVAESARCALALIDLQWTGSLECALMLRTNFAIPSIFIASSANHEQLSRTAKAQPVGYLIKPFKPDGLRAMVAVGLERRRLERRLQNLSYLASNDAERSLIGAAVHSSIAQPLAGIYYRLQTAARLQDLEPSRAAAELQITLDHMHHLLERLPRMTSHLRAQEIDPHDVLDVIERLADDFRRDTTRPLHLALPGRTLAVGALKAACLHRVVQHLLDHAARRSDALTSIALHLECVGRQLLVRFDDGHRLGPVHAQAVLGRIELAGGRAAVVDEAANPTLAAFEIPLDEETT